MSYIPKINVTSKFVTQKINQGQKSPHIHDKCHHIGISKIRYTIRNKFSNLLLEICKMEGDSHADGKRHDDRSSRYY